MKKILSLVLVLVLMAAFIPSVSAEGTLALELTNYGDAFLRADVTAEVFDGDYDIFAASFDADGTMLEKKFMGDGTALFDAENVSFVKAFCWKDDSSLEPICAAALARKEDAKEGEDALAGMLLGSFGFVTDIYSEELSFDETEYGVCMVTSEGYSEKLPFAKSVICSGYPGDYYYEWVVCAEEMYDIVFDYTGIVKYIKKDGMITHLLFPTLDNALFTENTAYKDDREYKMRSYSAENNKYGTIALAPDTIIFDIDTKKDIADAITVSTVGEAFIDGVSYNLVAYLQNKEAKALVTRDAFKPLAPETPEFSNTSFRYILSLEDTGNISSNTRYRVRTLDGENAVCTFYMSDYMNVFVGEIDGGLKELAGGEAFKELECGVCKIAFDEEHNVTGIWMPGTGGIWYDDTYAHDAVDKKASYSRADSTYGNIEITVNTILFDEENGHVRAGDVYSALKDGESYDVIAIGSDNARADVLLTKGTIGHETPSKDADYYYITQSGTSKIKAVGTDGVLKSYTITKDAAAHLDGYTGVAKLIIKSSKVTGAFIPGDEGFAAKKIEDDDDYYPSRNFYGRFDFSPDTPVFEVDTAADDPMSAVSVTTLSDAFEKGRIDRTEAFLEDGSVTAFAVFAARSSLDPEAYVMVVESKRMVVTSGQSTYSLTGIMGGKSVTYTVRPDAVREADDVERGNIIIFSVGKDGCAKDIHILLASSAAGVNMESLAGIDGLIATEPRNDMVSIAVDEVTYKGSYYFELGERGDTYVEFLGCKYTLVELMGKDINIKAASSASLRESTEDHKVYAFVKTICYSDYEVTDVVVFRYFE